MIQHEKNNNNNCKATQTKNHTKTTALKRSVA